MYLEFPGDSAEARQSEHAPHAIQTCEQRSSAGRHHRVGSAGGKNPTVVLENQLDGVLHHKECL